MKPWRLFIASSGGGLRYANAVKAVIDQQYGESICSLWEDGSFEEGRSFLDSLEGLPDKYNAGIAIFTADDQRGDLMTPRDNVVLELGLFLGVYGRHRTFLLVEKRADLKLPSDYEGITRNWFYSVDPGEPESRHRDSVKQACIKIVERLRSIKVPRAESLRRIEANWLRNCPDQEFKLYSFCGLRDMQQPSKSNEEEEVYYLWADAAAGNWIRARAFDAATSTDPAEHLWQVDFENLPGSFAGNVAFRLAKRAVLSAPAGGFKRLRFQARVPPSSAGGPPREPVAIALRVVDALTTHWEYCWAPHEYRLLKVHPNGEWQEFTIPLTNSDDWAVFASDGNYLYHAAVPDFSQILSVVMEVGSDAKGRPGPGAGTVQLKEVKAE